ncbi:hypothetical protein LPBF_01315 [Flavobacterium crassostreae]|uniref:C4-dicarboxylate ABC transporter n=1 Tax=Flavobacterium crassostreae TaxID=1763534 RepID=A0A1B9E9M5_9FLAO|nr:hypothetical protein LPBF_01315 [Flavobacterium crassostreae]
MKKSIFYISFLLFIYSLFRFLKIIIYDYEQLTEYGFGYLVAQTTFVIVFGITAFILRPKKTTKA